MPELEPLGITVTISGTLEFYNADHVKIGETPFTSRPITIEPVEPDEED